MRKLIVTMVCSALVSAAHCDDAIEAGVAATKIGENVVLEDVVQQVATTGTGTVFLNFGAAYPKEILAVVVMKDTLSRFPGIETWEGKKVHIEGMVTEHQGHPRIILRERGQAWPVE